MNLVQVKLGPSVLTYIEECLRAGSALATFLLSTGGLRAGEAFTFLPPQVSLEEAHRLHSGGKGPRSLAIQLLTERIYGQMQAHANAVCVLQDLMPTSRGSLLNEIDWPYFAVEEEVYYLLGQGSTASQIQGGIEYSSFVNNFLGVISFPELRWVETLTATRMAERDDLRLLATTAHTLFFDAYDGEGFLEWRPRP